MFSSPKIQDTILDIARALENHKLLTKVLGIDLIAAETKYHKNCLGNLFTKSSRKHMASVERSNQSDYVFEKAFSILVNEINDDLMNGVAFEMSHVLGMYRVKSHSLGYVNANKYKTEKLKSRLQKHFGKSITFHASVAANRPELFCCSSVDLKTSVNKIAELKRKLRKIVTDRDFDVVGTYGSDNNSVHAHAAFLLRSLFKDVNDISYKPCIVSSDICNENVEKRIPAESHNFLCLLITGKSQDSPDENNSQHANILVVVQDIIYMTSNKRCKTLKHVALAIAIKHSTGSKMITNILNKLGHCIFMTMLWNTNCYSKKKK